MTLHSKVNYQCKFCDTFFVPIPEAPNCPNCNIKSGQVFDDFVQDTLSSVLFNLGKFHSVMPPAWYRGTIGDFYYFNAFLFLGFVCMGVPVSRRKILKRRFSDDEIDSFTTAFLDFLPFEESRRAGLKIYFSLLLANRQDLSLGER